MSNQKKTLLLITLCLLFLFGCQQSFNKNISSDAIVNFEYLSLGDQFSDEVNNWLSKAKNSDENLYALSLEDGIDYVFGKGYKKAKVSYVDENIDGKMVRSVKATLLTGDKNDEILIKILYDTDIDIVRLDETNDSSQF